MASPVFTTLDLRLRCPRATPAPSRTRDDERQPGEDRQRAGSIFALTTHDAAPAAALVLALGRCNRTCVLACVGAGGAAVGGTAAAGSRSDAARGTTATGRARRTARIRATTGAAGCATRASSTAGARRAAGVLRRIGRHRTVRRATVRRRDRNVATAVVAEPVGRAVVVGLAIRQARLR